MAPASSSLAAVLDAAEFCPAKVLEYLSWGRALIGSLRRSRIFSHGVHSLRETRVCHVTHSSSHKHVPGTLNPRLMGQTTGNP